MSSWDILLLAAVQGVAEFLPVSSSGHLALMRFYCGMRTAGGPALEVALHAGTLVSVLVFYRSRIAALARGALAGDPEACGYAGRIALSAVPAALLYFLCGDFLERCFDSPLGSSVCLVATGLVLLSLALLPGGRAARGNGWLRSLLIGVAQAVAVLPGISRSGSTIAAAVWLGVSRREAAEFSFLMSLPVIGGAVLLKLKDILALAGGEGAVPGAALGAGFLVSAAVGLLSLHCLQRVLLGGRFWLFGAYCLAAGGLSCAWILAR